MEAHGIAALAILGSIGTLVSAGLALFVQKQRKAESELANLERDAERALRKEQNEGFYLFLDSIRAQVSLMGHGIERAAVLAAIHERMESLRPPRE
jgi:type II secretory pathway pseudopilin PulG